MTGTDGKAVRDRIPELIKAAGGRCVVHELSDDDLLVAMDAKLTEEYGEYIESKSVEELVDIVDVAYRIAELRGLDRERFEGLRAEKNTARGSFRRNLFSVLITDPES
ncbi:MAG: nucleoside triphosphate pyrophosphohydrolase [Thermoplasmata archaeon]